MLNTNQEQVQEENKPSLNCVIGGAEELDQVLDYLMEEDESDLHYFYHGDIQTTLFILFPEEVSDATN
jgi:hypothetical protein